MAGGERLNAAKGKDPNVFFIVGEDDYLTDRAAKAALAKFVPPGGFQSVECIDGTADRIETQMASIRAATASVATPPFLEPFRATWWRNVTFLPGGAEKRKLADEVKAALEKFASQLAANPLPPNQVLAITAPKVLASSIFAKTMKTAGETIVAGGGGKPRERRDAAVSLLADEAAAMGLSLPRPVAAAIVAKCGTDSRTLVSELAKIREWMEPGESQVPPAAVGEIVSPGAEPELWELTDAIARRDAAKAKDVLSRLEGSDSSAGILPATVLSKHFRDLEIMRGLADAGLVSRSGEWTAGADPDDLRRAQTLGFDTSKPLNFMQRRQLDAAMASSARYLAGAHRLAAGLRERLVSTSGGADPYVQIEIAVMRLVAAAR